MIKKGDILICENHRGNWLTEGKEYLAQGDEYMSVGHFMVVNVENDKGRLVPVLTSRFTIKPKTMDTLTTTKQNVQSAIDAGLMKKELAQKLFPGEFEEKKEIKIVRPEPKNEMGDYVIAVDENGECIGAPGIWLLNLDDGVIRVNNNYYDFKIEGDYLIPTRK